MMMISPDSIPSKPVATDPNQSSSSGSRKSSGAQRPPDHQQALKCPRCDSPNTKFCYYNNYSLTQPRHFCKTCRRYWTKGGALRNVPIGGGCRKSKKTKTGSRQFSSDDSFRDLSAGCYDTSGLKFFHGFTTAMEFQLAPPCLNMDASPNSSSLMGFHDYPVTSGGGVNWGAQEIGSMNVHNSLASSIESLSSINQDLHWKLQQQRLAMLFGGEKQEISSVSSVSGSLLEKPQSILFQNLEIPKPESCAVVIDQRKSGIIDGVDSTGAHDQWFFENSNNIPGATPANSSNNNGNEHTSHWNGIQAWSDMNQYSDLPQ